MSTEEGLMDKDANHAQEASGSRDELLDMVLLNKTVCRFKGNEIHKKWIVPWDKIIFCLLKVKDWLKMLRSAFFFFLSLAFSPETKNRRRNTSKQPENLKVGHKFSKLSYKMLAFKIHVSQMLVFTFSSADTHRMQWFIVGWHSRESHSDICTVDLLHEVKFG